MTAFLDTSVTLAERACTEGRLTTGGLTTKSMLIGPGMSVALEACSTLLS